MSTIITDLTNPPPSNTKSVLLFWATWHEDSSPSGSTSNLFETLSKTANSSSGSSSNNNNNDIHFYRVEAEQNPNLSSMYNVTIVPTFVFINGNNTIMKKIEGMDDIENIADVTNALQALIQSKATTATTSVQGMIEKDGVVSQGSSIPNPQEELNTKLKSLIHSSTIMLFMKGSPTNPRCGFSRQAVELLSSSNLIFGSFDILSDEDVRQGLKVYSDWPTYPQLYVNGELIGGLDIMKEMNDEHDGDLATALGIDSNNVSLLVKKGNSDENTPMTLDERLKNLIHRSKVMLFMKGLPSRPRCGFSRQICELLTEQKIEFDAFDILSDEDVRQGLKTYSDWPTYPQLYVDGELVGGLDIVKELIESGELSDMIEG